MTLAMLICEVCPENNIYIYIQSNIVMFKCECILFCKLWWIATWLMYIYFSLSWCISFLSLVSRLVIYIYIFSNGKTMVKYSEKMAKTRIQSTFFKCCNEISFQRICM